MSECQNGRFVPTMGAATQGHVQFAFGQANRLLVNDVTLDTRIEVALTWRWYDETVAHAMRLFVSANNSSTKFRAIGVEIP